MKVNKNIWTGKNKPYNRNSLYYPDGVNSGGGTPTPPSGGESSIYMKYYDLATMLASMGATIDMGTFITTIKSMVAPYVYMIGKLITPESNVMAIAPLNTISESRFKDVVSVGILYGYSIIEGEGKIEITPEYVNARLEGMPLDQFEITKEQFYSLN